MRLLARITGILFLVTIVTGVIAQTMISDRLVVFSDAAVTANNILTHRSLYQAGFTIYLIEMTCQMAVIALLYVLLKPVSHSGSFVAMVIGLAGAIIKTFSRVFYLAPLFLLHTPNSFGALTPEQLRALSLVLLKINDRGAAVALALFGVSAVLKGYLMLRATFFPRFLGILGILSSLGWLTFFYPPLGYRSFMIVAPLALLQSVILIYW
ncbi:MAG TPA: DUF4386 domain-containing protein, partial [Thermoanaerobaculia bacterium]|nr:DUF4386 domain-containing protein [Thermoanaerobaculia bacterium]